MAHTEMHSGHGQAEERRAGTVQPSAPARASLGRPWGEPQGWWPGRPQHPGPFLWCTMRPINGTSQMLVGAFRGSPLYTRGVEQP
jgi:hypothetical protein